MAKQKEQVTRQRAKGRSQPRRRLLVRDFPRRQRLAGVPPADSTIWPEQYRGEKWKSVYGIMFQGKCQLCAYSFEQPKSRQILDRLHGQSRLILCANHPRCPGELMEVLPTETCRNFKAKQWQIFQPTHARKRPTPAIHESDPSIRRIPLGNGLFTIVDATDYEMVAKYKWYAVRKGPTFYASCHKGGRTVAMHRMIMQARTGRIVDHIDGNGLNNRRCNLRVCTHRQNLANVRPRGGVSGFVGVYPCNGRWMAGIQYRGKHLYLGLFDDPVEAAKARDRKAYELHGPYAYLNRPQDFRRGRRGPGKGRLSRTDGL
jgi:hypothetical protein